MKFYLQRYTLEYFLNWILMRHAFDDYAHLFSASVGQKITDILEQK